MPWRRLGLVWGPDGRLPWARSHASLPTPVHLRDDTFRVFFSARDADNRSSVGWVDVVIGEQPLVERVGAEPALVGGDAGYFDDSGISIGSIVDTGDDHRVYYMGWNLGVRSPWHNSIGVAQGDATAGHFTKPFRGPLMDRSPEDPFTMTYPWVMKLSDGDWRCWYGSSDEWTATLDETVHSVKVARSCDGIRWDRSNRFAIELEQPTETIIVRPCVVRHGSGFVMWFATRGTSYRIGAAVSDDGESWSRADDHLGLAPARDGWDSEMVCYPCVFTHRDIRYMLYNGNDYGRRGFGLAMWEG